MNDKIIPCLWFDFDAEEVVAFYLRTFGDGRILRSSHYGDAVPQHRGKLQWIEFELFGRRYQALNGGPQYRLTPAVSMSVDCAGQAEVDRLWAALSAGGGAELACGWLTDRFGLSWQIVPRGMIEMITHADAAKSQRANEAMFTMKKLDLAAVRRAFDGE